jgi:hypothetical protein
MSTYFSLLIKLSDENGKIFGWPDCILENFSFKEFWGEGRPHPRGTLILETNSREEENVLQTINSLGLKVEKKLLVDLMQNKLAMFQFIRFP